MFLLSHVQHQLLLLLFKQFILTIVKEKEELCIKSLNVKFFFSQRQFAAGGHTLPAEMFQFFIILVNFTGKNSSEKKDMYQNLKSLTFCSASSQLVGTLSQHSSWVLGVDMSPDSSRFVSASADKTVRVWDARQKTLLHTFQAHQDQVRFFFFYD